MASSIEQIELRLINGLVQYAASIGVTINPNDWVLVPGNLSQTDYKLLLLNMVANGTAYEEQVNDLFQEYQESLIKTTPPQTGPWIQNQFLNIFQWDSSGSEIPEINATNGFVPTYPTPNDSLKVIDFCSVKFLSNGSVLIRVAANDNGVPADLDTTVGAGALDAARSFAYMCQSPGITYSVSSGNPDWLYLTLDVYYKGGASATIFQNVKDAITVFLNNLSINSLKANSDAIFRLSFLEDAILKVPNVVDVVSINVAARPDSNYMNPSLTTFGTIQQQFLLKDKTEAQRQYNTFAGYISLENGESSGTPSPVSYSKLEDARSVTDSTLNLNCIAV